MIINGLLLINKPTNITSNDVINKIKRNFKIAKIGHCGTLDPLASGLLIISIGDKTKSFNKIIEKKKRYIAFGIIGIKSDTYDINGKIIFYEKKYIKIRKHTIKKYLDSIQKKYKQSPPIFSSIKHNGINFYKYAKLEIKLNPKNTHINLFKLKIIFKTKNLIILDIICEKGTYIRSLIKYFGNKVQIPICIYNIYRISIGNFNILNSYSLKKIIKIKNIITLEKILIK